MFKDIVNFIRSIYNSKEFISLHEPRFLGNEKFYLNDCIDSTFVSSVGKFVDTFEKDMAVFSGAKRAVAVVNGTNALQVALRLVGVKENTEVITQPLSFIATCNAIRYLSADPVFVDVDKETMGLSPESLASFLEKYGEKKKDGVYNSHTGRKIAACLPMHTFGHPARIEKIVEVCSEWNIPVVEDAAESLGSYAESTHTGLFGDIGIFSFNGNKTITTGGGGMIVTNNEEYADKAKYLTTTAKKPHKWEFFHDELGYNFRMPNINAALGCAQLEKLPEFLKNKRETAELYQNFFREKTGVDFFSEREGTHVNYWLNCVILGNMGLRNDFLKYTNENGVMTRPIWTLMYRLPMYDNVFRIKTPVAEWLEERVVNIPSSVRV